MTQKLVFTRIAYTIRDWWFERVVRDSDEPRLKITMEFSEPADALAAEHALLREFSVLSRGAMSLQICFGQPFQVAGIEFKFDLKKPLPRHWVLDPLAGYRR
jgi:hypothetical protein